MYPSPLHVGQVWSGVHWQSSHSSPDLLPRHSISQVQVPGMTFLPLQSGHIFLFSSFFIAILTVWNLSHKSYYHLGILYNINLLSKKARKERFLFTAGGSMKKEIRLLPVGCKMTHQAGNLFFRLFTTIERVMVIARYMRATVNHISKVRNVSAIIVCACMVRS